MISTCKVCAHSFTTPFPVEGNDIEDEKVRERNDWKEIRHFGTTWDWDVFCRPICEVSLDMFQKKSSERFWKRWRRRRRRRNIWMWMDQQKRSSKVIWVKKERQDFFWIFEGRQERIVEDKEGGGLRESLHLLFQDESITSSVRLKGTRQTQVCLTINWPSHCLLQRGKRNERAIEKRKKIVSRRGKWERVNRRGKWERTEHLYINPSKWKEPAKFLLLTLLSFLLFSFFSSQIQNSCVTQSLRKEDEKRKEIDQVEGKRTKSGEKKTRSEKKWELLGSVHIDMKCVPSHISLLLSSPLLFLPETLKATEICSNVQTCSCRQFKSTLTPFAAKEKKNKVRELRRLSIQEKCLPREWFRTSLKQAHKH